MKRRLLIALTVTASLAFAGACKKKDDDKNKKKPKQSKVQPKTDKPKTDPPKTDKPKTDPPKTAKMSLADRHKECWTAFETKDWKKAADCCAPDAVERVVDTPMTTTGHDKIIEGNKLWRAGFDLRSKPEIVLINGNTIVTLVSASGTNVGPYPPMGLAKATNKKIASFGLQVIETENMKAKTITEYWDGGLLMAQLMGKAPKDSEKFAGWGLNEWVTAKDGDATKDSVAVVQKVLDALKKKDLKGFVAGWDPEVVTHMNGMPDLKGIKAKGAFMKALTTAFPDFAFEVKQIHGAGNYVFVSAEWTGTNKAAFPPMIAKATNKKVKLTNGELFKIENGKIKEQWIVMNTGALMGQLGLIKMDKKK